MKVRRKLRLALGAAVAVLGVTGAVWASSAFAGRAHTASYPTVTIAFGTAPDYLDPSETYTTQGAEGAWVSYLGLYTYAHKNGAAGGAVIPALATAEPVVSDGGKTYTMYLRKGEKFSNGAKVVASDFTFAIERALKLNWGGDSWFTGNIVGALAYQKGSSKTISGIQTNDATGKIVVHLLAPYGAFINIMAFPEAGLLPSSTPMKSLTNNPPPGFGPYEIKDVVPDKSWEGVPNPFYTAHPIAGIPVAHVIVKAEVESTTTLEAEDVLNGSADLFDTGDQVPPSVLSQAKSSSSANYGTYAIPQTFYFFLNTKTKPFNSQLVREAVNYALDRRVLARLASGNIVPGCYFIPPGLVGHNTRACPYGNPAGAPNLKKAKQLIAQSGDKGDAVTVWSEERQPRTQYCTYYASVLSSLGFKVTIKPISDSNYFPTIGNLKNEPQTGFADWDQDFPNPIDFYLLLTKAGIQSVNNENFSQVDDPKIESAVSKLAPVPSNKLSTVATQWKNLDYYAAKKAYELVFGYQLWPKFASSKVNYKALVIQPSYGWDWTSIRLK
jgi:peptide/nickel transport system substrate-binding protein